MVFKINRIFFVSVFFIFGCGNENAELLNLAPIIEKVLPLKVMAGSYVSVNIIAQDPEGDSLTYAVQNGPKWASINTEGILSLTPNETDSNQTFFITVSDGIQLSKSPISVEVSGYLPQGYGTSIFSHDRIEINETIAPIVDSFDTMIRFTPSKQSRELYDYDPRFLPAPISFDSNNRPWMLVPIYSNDPELNHRANFSRSSWVPLYIQTLNNQGEWVGFYLSALMKKKYPSFSGEFSFGHGAEEIINHNDDGLYFLVYARGIGQVIIQYSRSLQEWHINKISKERVSYIPNTNDDDLYIGYYSKLTELYLTELTKNKNGIFNSSNSYPVFRHPTGGNIWVISPETHSGGRSAIVTKNNKSYFVFASDKFIPNVVRYTKDPEYSHANQVSEPGTPHYLGVWDHLLNKLVSIQFLGVTYSTTQSEPDNHNLPVILADLKGRIHVILGSHQRPFVHYQTEFLDGNEKDWLEPHLIYWKLNYEAHVTYPSILIDKNNNIQLILRQVDNDDGYFYTLMHFWFEHNSNRWSKGIHLIQPDYASYSIFYHELTKDKNNRLFVRYFYFDKTKSFPTTPELLMSDDNGMTWKLVTTKILYTNMDLE